MEKEQRKRKANNLGIRFFGNTKGEISNLKFHTRGHLYFSLKDENSKINAVMFNYKNMNLDFEIWTLMSVL